MNATGQRPDVVCGPWWRWGPLMIVMVAGAVVAVWQRDERAKLEAELARLEQRRVESATVAVSAVQSGLAEDPGELERLRGARHELMKLRGEIGELRARAVAASGTGTVAELQQQAVAARAKADLLKARLEAKDSSERSRQAVSMACSLVQAVAQQQEGRVPANWNELRAALDRPWKPEEEPRRGMILHLWESMRTGAIPPESLELLPVGERFDPAHRNAVGAILVLRERQPRALPDGGWARTYAFLSGETEEAQSRNGDFDAWERQAIAERK